MNKSNSVEFNHALHGRAMVMLNESFKPSKSPTSIDYLLFRTREIKQSSFEDAGYRP
jgi:hypothetical protein